MNDQVGFQGGLLHIAARQGAVEPAALLIKHYNATVDFPFWVGRTALHVACEEDSAGVVEVMLSTNKADVNLVTKADDVNGYTAMHLAAYRKN